VYESYNSNITFYNISNNIWLTGGGNLVGCILYAYNTINLTFINVVFNGKLAGS